MQTLLPERSARIHAPGALEAAPPVPGRPLSDDPQAAAEARALEPPPELGAVAAAAGPVLVEPGQRSQAFHHSTRPGQLQSTLAPLENSVQDSCTH